MNQIRKEIRRLWSCMEGIRLQPFISLETGEQTGQEVLSLLSEGIDPELFFQSFTPEVCLLQFFGQLDVVMPMNLATPCFLNLPIRVLAEPECIRLLMQIPPRNRRGVVIELQDPSELVIAEASVIAAVKDGITSLRHDGWSVWLDDLTQDMCNELSRSRLQFDGVKIDSKELVRCRHDAQLLASLVTQARFFVAHQENNILIEGVETDSDLACARNSNALWGQGYLWPETKVAFR